MGTYAKGVGLFARIIFRWGLNPSGGGLLENLRYSDLATKDDFNLDTAPFIITSFFLSTMYGTPLVE